MLYFSEFYIKQNRFTNLGSSRECDSTEFQNMLYFYRLMHHPLFYKRIHKLHHEWTAPIAMATVYVHPFEHIVSEKVFWFLKTQHYTNMSKIINKNVALAITILRNKNWSSSCIGRAITRSSLEWKTWGSNLGPVKSDTLWPTTRHRCDIFFKRSCVARAQWSGNGPRKLVTRFGILQRL